MKRVPVTAGNDWDAWPVTLGPLSIEIDWRFDLYRGLSACLPVDVYTTRFSSSLAFSSGGAIREGICAHDHPSI